MSFESVLWSLRFVDCPPTEKLVLIGIASHDGDGGAWPSEATLAKYANVTERHVRRLVASLVERGLVTVHVNQGGNTKTRGDRRPNLYEVHRPEMVIPAATGGHFDAERVDTQMSTEPLSEPLGSSSSLRSEEELSEQVVEPRNASREVATAYWDWHTAETGVGPAQDFKALMSVAKVSLRRGCNEDEIMDAWKLMRRSKFTAANTIDKVGLTRRERENRPSTAAIPSEVVKAFTAAAPFLMDRWGPTWLVDRPALMGAVAHLVRLGYGVGESMIRLAVGMRAVDTDNVYWLMNIDIPRFAGGLADYPRSMEVAYKNQGWRA